jgi:streptogramin lyase
MSHRRHAGRALASIVLLAVAATAAAGPAGAVTRTISEFKIVTANSQPGDMTVGADDNVWFVDQNTDKIGRITKKGGITGFLIPTPTSKPTGITTGSDGAVWFTESAGNKIGRTVTGRTFGQTTISNAASSPRGITAGPDGNLYFVEYAAHTVNKILVGAPHTISTVATLPVGSGPVRIATGPDGNLWVTESKIHSVARVALPGGAITQVALPASAAPSRIVAGPDGNMWVAEPGINRVAQITTAATPVVSQISVPGKPTGIAAGGDGNTMWVTEQSGNNIARIIISPLSVKAFAIPTKSSSPGGITLGGDGNVWFSENAGDKIGRLFAVSGHSSYVIVHDNAYAPMLQGIALQTGTTHKPTTVRWVFQTGEHHSVTDSSGMGLFNSGSMAPGAAFAHTFTTAGTFDYNSTVGAAFAGTPQIKVTPQAAVNAGHTAIVVTIATSVPGGATLNVQVALPGSSTFNPAPAGTGLSGTTYTYSPTGGPGVYKFQVQTAVGGNSSGFSPAARATF